METFMSVIDSEPQPQRAFLGKLQRFWEYPHPHGWVAMLKSALDNIEDTVNGSIAATGAPPSTEEEAFRLNQLRDRGAIGAFNAASKFGPATPEFVGAALGRHVVNGFIPQAPEGRFPRYLNGPRNGSGPSSSGALPYPPGRPEINPRGWQPSASGGSVPSVPPPAVGAAPSGGLLARLRELDALERQSLGSNIGPASPERNPNFRQLTRIPSHSLGTGALGAGQTSPPRTAADVAAETQRALSWDDLDIPDFLRRQPKPDIGVSDTETKSGDSPKSSIGRGGGNGGDGDGGGGWGGNEEDCKKEYKRALELCVDAFSNGFRGDGKRWKSDYDTGPYSKESGTKWDVRDCMRGHMSKRCLGNEYELPPKPTIKKYRLR
jgi:hypothetical protein